MVYMELPIFEETYRFVLWIYPAVNKFPKSQRFVLGQQIENLALDILKGVIRANGERDKLPYLKDVSVRLDLLRILIRLAKDLRLLSIIQYFATDQAGQTGTAERTVAVYDPNTAATSTTQ